jgi:hypothetical protein
MYLPHDAEHKRLGENPDTNRSIREMLEDMMPGVRFETVPRVTRINSGITATRNVFASCWFDATHCKQGITRLANYRKKWNRTTGNWSDEPMHDANSHGADAFRQFGQVADKGETFNIGAQTQLGKNASWRRNRGSPMAV